MNMQGQNDTGGMAKAAIQPATMAAAKNSMFLYAGINIMVTDFRACARNFKWLKLRRSRLEQANYEDVCG